MPCIGSGTAEKQCFKISFRWHGSYSPISCRENMNMQFAMKFSNKHPAYGTSGWVMLTSEENSYGLAGGTWFDGFVQCIRASSEVVYEILEVTEYINQPSACSESYYQCLAKRFIKYDFGKNSRMTQNGSKCSDFEACSPYSLPFDKKIFPICKDKNSRICYDNILRDLESEQEKYCKKSCHVKEFKTKMLNGLSGMERKWGSKWTRWQNESWTWNDTFMPHNAQFFEYSFHSPISRTNIRTKRPFKTIHRECWKMSGMSLIGNIGGTLGMFVGFSFLGSFEWFLDTAERSYRAFKKLKEK